MRTVIRMSWFMAWAHCIMNDQWTLSSEQCQILTIMVHCKCKYNCFVCDKIQKPHLNNNIKVVIQTGKTLSSRISWHDLFLNLFTAVRIETGLEKVFGKHQVYIGNVCLFLEDGRSKQIDIISSFLRLSYWFYSCLFVAERRGEPSCKTVIMWRGKRDCKNYNKRNGSRHQKCLCASSEFLCLIHTSADIILLEVDKVLFQLLVYHLLQVCSTVQACMRSKIHLVLPHDSSREAARLAVLMALL